MINSGRNILIRRNGNLGLPNVSDVLPEWFQDISFEIVERYLPDNSADWEYKPVQTINTQGVVQPPSAKDLKIMPEGSWAWEWQTVHCLPNVQFNVNQFVKYDEIIYKVMSKKDWSKYGYVKYWLLEAYQAEGLENE